MGRPYNRPYGIPVRQVWTVRVRAAAIASSSVSIKDTSYFIYFITTTMILYNN